LEVRINFWSAASKAKNELVAIAKVAKKAMMCMNRTGCVQWKHWLEKGGYKQHSTSARYTKKKEGIIV
jgi:hypothetical protein